MLHSALELQDQSLAKMDEEKFRAGLSAKINISLRIVQVFQKEKLDFVMFFSSISSFVKIAGQSNYAAGCIFKDVFASRLSQEWNCAVKVINLGYIGLAGVVASEEYRERMEKLGLGSIELPEIMENWKSFCPVPSIKLC